MSVETDHQALDQIAQRLRAAGTALDRASTSMPGAVDAGVATELLAAVLHTFADTSARLTYEADHLAGVTEECVADYRATDSGVTERFRTLGQW
ncbi:hypothetical protein [Cellulomonas sp. ICMP 17802]|uniref:hypothetical protein n=1 Tax=Cellulomonas sp. ICMP 17802 TaxID=3239199 RepID=UPI00351ACFD9